MPSDDKLRYDRVLFEIRVIESFSGMEKVGDVVSIRTGFGGGDCGYSFKIGAKYLIDASKSEDVFFTGICFLTAPLENSEVELGSLRRLAAGQRLPDLVGILMRGTETDDGENITPLSGITVQAKRIAGGSTQKTATDAPQVTLDFFPNPLWLEQQRNVGGDYFYCRCCSAAGVVPSRPTETRAAVSADKILDSPAATHLRYVRQRGRLNKRLQRTVGCATCR